jgi:hypothetical protein
VGGAVPPLPPADRDSWPTLVPNPGHLLSPRQQALAGKKLGLPTTVVPRVHCSMQVTG